MMLHFSLWGRRKKLKHYNMRKFQDAVWNTQPGRTNLKKAKYLKGSLCFFFRKKESMGKIGPKFVGASLGSGVTPSPSYCWKVSANFAKEKLYSLEMNNVVMRYVNAFLAQLLGR